MNRSDWMEDRIGKLHRLLVRSNYKGRDPFDLPNSPFLRIFPEQWAWIQLPISKFGARFPFSFLRTLFRTPVIEDPKIYACSYFAYAALGDGYAQEKRKMIEGLTRLAKKSADGFFWGYDFTWPTLYDGTNRKGASTLVPSSFALFALMHEAVNSNDAQLLSTVQGGVRHIANAHARRDEAGEFLGYFTHSTVNTHNANLLGCAVLILGAKILGEISWKKTAVAAMRTTLKAVEPDGFLPYNSHRRGRWTDNFHHLYCAAALELIAGVHSELESEIKPALERLYSYAKRHFLRDDGWVNYYPDRLYPIDPHNYAATAIFIRFFPGRLAIDAEDILHKIDEITWLPEKGHYLHRIFKSYSDRRLFLRWNQVWMFLALATAARPPISLNIFSTQMSAG